MFQTITINDITIKYTEHDNKVFWCNNGAKIWDLVKLGHVTYKFYKNLFGHYDFFYNGN